MPARKAGYFQAGGLEAVVRQCHPADLGVIFSGNDDVSLSIDIGHLPEIAGMILKEANPIKVRFIGKRGHGRRPHLIGVEAADENKGAVLVSHIFPPAADPDIFIAAVAAAAVGKQDRIAAIGEKMAVGWTSLGGRSCAPLLSSRARPSSWSTGSRICLVKIGSNGGVSWSNSSPARM